MRGVFHDAQIGETSTVLLPGDGLALYTDGLPEAQAPNRFGSTVVYDFALDHAVREQLPPALSDAIIGTDS